MEIRDLTERVRLVSDMYASEFNVQRNSDWYLLKLAEEIGELVRSYLQFTGQSRSADIPPEEMKRNLADELADVFSMTMLVADDHGIDLEDAVQTKWLGFLDDQGADSI